MNCFFHKQKTHIQLIILKFDELFDESLLRSMNVSIVDSYAVITLAVVSIEFSVSI